MTAFDKLTQHRNKLDLNGTSACFMCLQESITPEHIFSLRTLFRYLKINCESVIQGRLNRGGGENGESQVMKKQKLSDAQAVILCEQCRSILEPLSNLCIELELLHMRVHDHLKSVIGVLECSPPSEDLTNHCKGNATTAQTKYNHGKFTRFMRQEFHQKCVIKLNQAVPKVLLTGGSSVLLQNKIKNIKPSNKKESGENSCTNNTSTPQTSGDETGGVQPDNETLQDKAKKRRFQFDTAKNSHSQFKTCYLCNPPRLIPIKFADHHNVARHIDNWFISYKQLNLHQDDFEKYCSHVLRVELLSFVRHSDAKGNSLAKCPHCPFTASTTGKTYLMRRHVCMIHKEIVAKKLVQLQRSTTLDELQTFQFPPAVNFCLPEEDSSDNKAKGRGHQCTTCGKIFNSLASLSTHKTNARNIDCRSIQRIWNCAVCGKVFQKASNLWNHKRITHGNGNCDFILKSNKKFLCRVCGTEFNNSGSLWKHQKKVHEKQIPCCNICGQEFGSHSSMTRHRRETHDKSNATSAKRNIPGNKYSQLSSSLSVDIQLQGEKSMPIHEPASISKRKTMETSRMVIQSENVGEPIVLAKVETLEDSKVNGIIGHAGQPNDIGLRVHEEEQAGVPNEEEYEDVPSHIQSKILVEKVDIFSIY